MKTSKWDIRYMSLAKHYSSWSKDPSTKIGAVAVSDNKLQLSSGWNGFPRGIEDDGRLKNRETKYSLVVHAEMNVIYNAARNGISLVGASLYVYGLPICSECAKGVIQSGIKKVFIVKESISKSEFWEKSWDLTRRMFEEAGVNYYFISEEEI